MRVPPFAVAGLCLALSSCGGEEGSGGGSGGTSSVDGAGGTAGGVGGTAGSAGSTAGGAGGSAAAGAGGASGGGGSAMAGAGGTGGVPDQQRFAVIGDFGDSLIDALGIGGLSKVGGLVKSWNPDFIITTGDNNYPDGAAGTIDSNIGAQYASFIGNYVGAFGPGSAENRFWPTPGNHDWRAANLQPYIDYFTLPGNERYYDVQIGRVHLFALDSESDEPDGADENSVQAQWLQDRVASSTACFKLAYFHRPPYSSGDHGSNDRMKWPFEAWGIDVVLSGHDHTYERLRVGAIPYFVNGLGGSLKYAMGTAVPESELFYNLDFGAQLVTVTDSSITFEFHAVLGGLIDTHTVSKACN